MNRKQFAKRTQELLRAERSEPYQWHYCSFAGEEGFRGAVVLQAHGIIECAIRARSLGANPGGELLAVPIEDESILPPEQFRNRLLSKEEVQSIWSDAKSIREFEEEGDFRFSGSR